MIYDTNINNKTEAHKYFIFYLGIIHFLYLAVTLMSGKKIPVFIVIDIVAIYSAIITLKYIFKLKFNPLDFAVLLYILLSLFSLALYLQKDHPASIIAYAYGLHLLIIPMFLFFSVKILTYESKLILIRSICYLNIFFIIYGFIMFYLQPEYFTEYLLSHLTNIDSIEDKWIAYTRLQSYFGSSAVGTLSWITMILLMILNVKSILRIILFSLLIVAALLSQQRGGILGVFLALGYFIFAKKESIKNKMIFIIIGVSLIIGLIFYFSHKYEDILPYNMIEYTKDRLVSTESIQSIFKERESGREKGWDLIKDYPLGLGVGATTGGADYAGANKVGAIVDANYFRIIVDLGVQGIIIFMIIITLSIKSAFKKENSFLWLIFIGMYCVQALGSNVFDNFYVSHMFWLLLGIMDSSKNKVKRKTMLSKFSGSVHIHNIYPHYFRPKIKTNYLE